MMQTASTDNLTEHEMSVLRFLIGEQSDIYSEGAALNQAVESLKKRGLIEISEFRGMPVYVISDAGKKRILQ
jgi:hypothetical protein